MKNKESKFEEGYFEEKAKNYNIIGKDLSPKKKTEVVAYLEGRKDSAAEVIEGEYLKTKEQFDFINYIKECLDSEFKELGINKKANIMPEQIHLLPKDVFLRKTDGDDVSPAFFHSLNQGILINRDHYPRRMNLFKAVIHEMIHSSSFLRFKEQKGGARPLSSKVGYSAYFKQEEEGYRQFSGLNEMVIDRFIPEIFRKHEEKFIKKFKLTKNEQNEGLDFYPKEILNTIINKISTENNEDKKDVWERFKRGLFTGEVMHLRDIEETFGKNSLRLLSMVNFDHKETKDNYEQILECFETDDSKKREEIIGKLLPELEKQGAKSEEDKIPQERQRKF